MSSKITQTLWVENDSKQRAGFEVFNDGSITISEDSGTDLYEFCFHLDAEDSHKLYLILKSVFEKEANHG